MSKPMSMTELGELIKYIRDNNSWESTASLSNRRVIKYVDPHIDFRGGPVCFSITFRGYGEEVTLHTQNECRNLEESLFSRCKKFLNQPLSEITLDVCPDVC